MPNRFPLDGQLCFSIYSTSMAINRMYKPLLDGMGVTYPQYLVLTVLGEEDGQTISAIGERLALEPSTITPLAKRLERAGFLSRSRNTKDEREVQVSLTAKGKKLFNQSGCLTDKLIRNSGMTAEDLVSLNERVQSLRDAIKRNNGASPA
jgi:DNA-binding MarR family transcriptional regulator